MTTAISFQMIFLLFAVSSAYEEAAFTFPFREIDFKDKERQLKIAHRSGAMGMICLGLGAGVIQAFSFPGLWIGFLTGIACLFCYWLVFDIVYAIRIGQKWSYLGSTAGTDQWLTKLLGRNAGAKKGLFCLIVLIAINLTIKIFY